MNKSGGGILLLIGFIIYIVKENWVFILVAITIIGLLWILFLWFGNKKESKYNTTITDNHNAPTTANNYTKINSNIPITDNNTINDNIPKYEDSEINKTYRHHSYTVLSLNDIQQNKLFSFIKYSLDYSKNLHTINSIRRIQNYQEEYTTLNSIIRGSLFGFIINCSNETLFYVKESNHKSRIVAECKTIILIITELKNGSSNEHITNLLSVYTIQSDRLDSFIKHAFKASNNYPIIKSINRIQRYVEEYNKQYWQQIQLFDFIINSINDTLNTIKESTHKNRIISECKTCILIIEELKKGKTNEEIIRLLSIGDEQYDRISSFINNALKSPINYSIINSITRTQKHVEEYNKQYWRQIQLFDFIINSANDALNNIKESTHKNRIIAECKTCILIIEELKKGKTNEEIIDLLNINAKLNDRIAPINHIQKISVDKTSLSKKTLDKKGPVVCHSKKEATKEALSVSDIITMLLSSKLGGFQIENETIDSSECIKDLVILNKKHKSTRNINVLDIVLGVLAHNKKNHFNSSNQIQIENNIKKATTNVNSIVKQTTDQIDINSDKSFTLYTSSDTSSSTKNIIEIAKPQSTNILDLIEGVIKHTTNRHNSDITEAKEKNNLSFECVEDEKAIIDITDTPAYKISIKNPDIKYNSINYEKTSTIKEHIAISDYSRHPFLFRGRNKDFLFIKPSEEAPHWDHTYIYDVSPLKYSNHRIKKFYNTFKKSFFEGIYYDLHLSSNYYFTLLFDLLNEYENHTDIIRLEQQLYTISNYYPKVMKYAIDNLLNIIDSNKDTTININTLIEHYPNYHWRLSYKYASKFSLSEDEQQLFNKLLYTPNKFSSIENIQYEIIELFLHTLRKYGAANLNNKVISVAKNIIGEYFPRHFTSGSETIEIEIWYCIYKQCENTVRSLYSINEKQNIYSSYYTQKSESIINDEIIIPLKNIISLVKNEQPVINRNTEIKLNENFPTRWRRAYDQLVQESVNRDIEYFINGLRSIHEINTSNANIKSMYYEAMKITYKTEPALSLKLYIEYITMNMSDIGGKEKTIPKYISKELFKIESQEESFTNIVRIYKEDSDKIKANDAIDKLYTQERRKIKLNTYEINKIAKLHSKTVQLLNDVLDDELENNEHKQINEETASYTNDNMNINIIQSVLNVHEQELLYIFREENYNLNKTEVESYAKSLNLMPNRLIEKINDTFFDILDDVLIEDEGDNWAISEDYFKIISKNETKYKN